MELQKPQENREPKEKGKPLVKDLNEHIVCPLCRGYLIDATTLVECLHSFCRGCIVRHFRAVSKTCPACGTHAVAPLVSDIGLQRLVYLVVPGLFKSEQERRKNFRQVNSPQCANLNQPPLGAPDLSFDDLVSLSLSEVDSTADGSTRYLKCPAGVTVRHLLRLLMLKRGWDDADGNSQQCGNKKIEMIYEVSRNGAKNEFEILNPSWTLMDLACIFEWKRESPMKLLYRIVQVDDTSFSKPGSNFCATTVTDSNQAIENIQRPPTPPPSPKPTISRSTVVDQYSNSKDIEPKKPRCEVTPVMRAPDPPAIGSSKSGKMSRPEHQHKRKKRKNKRVIAEITTLPREDLLKLKVRLTPVPARVTSNTASDSQAKDKILQMRAVRKEKTKSENIQKNRVPKDSKIGLRIIDDRIITGKELIEKKETTSQAEKSQPSVEPKSPDEKEAKPPAVEEVKEPEKEEPPKNEEVLRRLGLVAISEANKTRQEKTKSASQSSVEKADPAVEREKLEKQLRESKANRVRSLLAEKQMRDTLKSIMSTSKETNLTNASGTPSSSSSSRSATPTTSSAKRKEPPPLTPLRSAKRPNVTFAPAPFAAGKCESPLDLSNPSNNSSSKDNALDLSSGLSEAASAKSGVETKPVGILRNSASRLTEKPKEETKKHDTNLRTLSDAAVSLLGDRSVYHLDKSAKLPQSFLGQPGLGASGKVALRIPQPHQRFSSFGTKIKPNIAVRHIPNPQAVVASQYRNQRTGYFNMSHQPP